MSQFAKLPDRCLWTTFLQRKIQKLSSEPFVSKHKNLTFMVFLRYITLFEMFHAIPLGPAVFPYCVKISCSNSNCVHKFTALQNLLKILLSGGQWSSGYVYSSNDQRTWIVPNNPLPLSDKSRSAASRLAILTVASVKN